MMIFQITDSGFPLLLFQLLLLSAAITLWAAALYIAIIFI